ncbi:MAG: STAS domain-containing protein [Nitrospirota bacterium]
MQANLKISTSPLEDNNQVISFDGEFDKAGHSEISTELDDAVKAFQGTNLIFDFTRLKFINSEGIGYLMEIHTHLIKLDKKLIIVGLNSHVADVFRTIGISEIISVHDTLDDFLKK